MKSSFALSTLAILATSALLSACGQTGPLTMPKPPKHGAAAPAAPPPATAPASIAVPPSPAAGTALPLGDSNANNTQATQSTATPASSVPASH